MIIKQAYEKLQTDGRPVTLTMYNAMFDITFDNNGVWDETQFTVCGEAGKQQIIEALSEFYADFCKTEGIGNNTVLSITYVGRDPEA